MRRLLVFLRAAYCTCVSKNTQETSVAPEIADEVTIGFENNVQQEDSEWDIDEVLINEVCKKLALYDARIPITARSKTALNDLWLEIHSILGVDDIKKRWKTIRDSTGYTATDKTDEWKLTFLDHSYLADKCRNRMHDTRQPGMCHGKPASPTAMDGCRCRAKQSGQVLKYSNTGYTATDKTDEWKLTFLDHSYLADKCRNRMHDTRQPGMCHGKPASPTAMDGCRCRAKQSGQVLKYSK
ncbi:hypothetical protein FQR65_LT16191 [Abscondita terminalis]|nr:hypothetical protein FQR65_LT16191 [Abscondita terminalis]